MTVSPTDIDVMLDASGMPLMACVNHSEFPNSWFPVPKGTSLEQAKSFTRAMETACWRAGYEELKARLAESK